MPIGTRHRDGEWERTIRSPSVDVRSKQTVRYSNSSNNTNLSSKHWNCWNDGVSDSDALSMHHVYWYCAVVPTQVRSGSRPERARPKYRQSRLVLPSGVDVYFEFGVTLLRYRQCPLWRGVPNTNDARILLWKTKTDDSEPGTRVRWTVVINTVHRS